MTNYHLKQLMKTLQSLGGILLLLLLASTSHAQSIVTDFNMPVPLAYADIDVIEVCDDGKILIAGTIDFYDESKQYDLLRLNADGSLDESFAFSPDSTSFIDLAVLSTGEIIGLDSEYLYKIATTGEVLKIVEDESVSSFTTSGEIVIKDDLIYVVVGDHFFRKYTSELELDATFNNSNGFSGTVKSLAFQNDKIIVCGGFSAINGVEKHNVARFGLDGQLDETFDVGSGTTNTLEKVLVQDDGKVVIGEGFIGTFSGVSIEGVVRLDVDGVVDTGFNTPNFNGPSVGIQLQGDKILVAALITIDGTTADHLVRLNSNGSLDASFTEIETEISEIAVNATDEILINSTDNTLGLKKFSADGSTEILNLPIYEVGYYDNAAYFNDFIILTGDFYKIGDVETTQIGKIDMQGNVDSNFIVTVAENPESQEGFTPVDIEIRSENEIYVSTLWRILSLDNNGNLNSDFSTSVVVNPGGADDQNFAHLFEFLSDGRIVTAGPNGVYLLNDDGTQDTGFFGDGDVNGGGLGIAVQSSDKIIYGGSFNEVNEVSANKLVRLNLDGSIDDTFDIGTGPDEAFGSVDYVNVLPNDEVIIFSDNGFDGFATDLGIYKLGVDGGVDPDFVDNLNQTKPEGLSFWNGFNYKNETFLVAGFQTIGVIDSTGVFEADFELPETIDSPSFGPKGLNNTDVVWLEENLLLLLGQFNVDGETELKNGLLIRDNEHPLITGVINALTTLEATPITINIEDVTVEDSDNTFPDDFTLTVQEGSDYTVEQNIVTPNTGFSGTLTVPLIVNDGYDDSPVFEASVEVVPVLGIHPATQFTLYPNPTAGFINISLGDHPTPVEIVVRNLTGKVLGTFSFDNDQEVKIDLAGKAGIYLIEIISPSFTYTYKILKK